MSNNETARIFPFYPSDQLRTSVRTVIRCRPHNSQSCLSFTGLASHEISSSESGLTRSVIMYIMPSPSTTSMNLSMSGCLVTRSLRTAFWATGSRLRLCWLLNSKTDTGVASSWTGISTGLMEKSGIYPLNCIIQSPDTKCVQRWEFPTERKWEVEARLLYDGRDGSSAKCSEIIHANGV